MSTTTDPWASYVPPTAAPDLEGDTCHCWMADCAECGPKMADGKRPRPGEVRRSALQADASLQAAKESWYFRCLAVTPGREG